MRLEGGMGPLWWCVTEVEVGPDLVQLSGVRRALEFWDLPSTQPHLQSRLCLPEKKEKKKKSPICLTLLPPPAPQTICAGSGAGLLGGPIGSRGGIELWLQLLSVVIGVSVLCGARLCPPSPECPPHPPCGAEAPCTAGA